MFTIKTDSQSVKSSGTGGKFIGTSGIYPVTINFASSNKSNSGAKSVNFNVSYSGETQTFYGPYYEGKTGNTLEFGTRVYNNLGVIAEMQDGDTPTIVQETHEVGKDNKPIEFDVIDEFSGLDVYIQIREVYESYQNNITRKLEVIGFWNAAGSSAEEVVNDSNHGDNKNLVEEKYASNVVYKDVTEEEVAIWKTSKAEGSSNSKSAKTSPKNVRKTVKFGVK